MLDYIIGVLGIIIGIWAWKDISWWPLRLLVVTCYTLPALVIMID